MWRDNSVDFIVKNICVLCYWVQLALNNPVILYHCVPQEAVV